MSDLSFFSTSMLAQSERSVLRGGGRKTEVLLPVRVGYFHHKTLGHTLIDTGHGAQAVYKQPGEDILLSIHRKVMKPTILHDDPLGVGLAHFGLRKDQIDTVIVTHLHPDHIGGLRDLPQARLICARASWNAHLRKNRLTNAMDGVFTALMPDDMADRLSFIEDMPQLTAPHDLGPGYDLLGDGTMLAIDLPGHAPGHFGICLPADNFLYAVDVQWLLQAIEEDRSPGPPAHWIQHDARASVKTFARLRAFMKAGGDVILCHEPRIHPRDVDRNA